MLVEGRTTHHHAHRHRLREASQPLGFHQHTGTRHGVLHYTYLTTGMGSSERPGLPRTRPIFCLFYVGDVIGSVRG